MRLTLRGLLAYLDDRLTPESAAQVGDYVGEHDNVRQLTDRIKRVIRRRRLSTPDVADRQEMPPLHQDDPNEVAAYLDGTMNQEQEADFEEICIDTDVYLAEVAAVHQIMTFGNDTLKVPPLARQRMVSLVKGPEAQPLKVVPKESRPSKPPLWEVSDSAPANEDEENQALLEPLYHNLLESRWSRTLMAVGAGLLAAVLVFFVWSLPWDRLPTSTGVAEVMSTAPDVEKDKPPLALVDKQPIKPVDKIAEKVPEKVNVPVVVKPAFRSEGVWPVAVISREGQPAWQSAAESIAGITGMVAARPALPLNVFLGLGEESSPNEPVVPLPPVAAAKMRIAAPERNSHVPVATNGAEAGGMFLQQYAGDEWRITKPAGSILSNTKLVALPGYTGNIAMTGGLKVILMGQFTPNLLGNPAAESIVELHPTQEADLDITLHRGRLIIQGRPLQQMAATVRLRYFGETWELKMPAGSEIGIGARGQVVANDGPWEVEQILELIVSKGSVEIKHEEQAAMLIAKQRLTWSSQLKENQQAVQSELSELPVWLAKYQTAPKEAVDGLVSLRSRTHAKLTRDGKDLTWFSLACDEVLEEGKLIERQAALLNMAAIDHLKPIITLMNDAAGNGRRKYAHEVVHHWLNQDISRAQGLLDYLKESGYADDDAKLLLSLFRGTTQATPATLNALLLDLAHGRVAIREQAWQVLSALVPDRPNVFDPVGTPEQRAKAISIVAAKVIQKKAGDVPPPP